ncbi:hypothetical protein C9374_007185 [Naegleria lovaniensis]|uniref:Uncharacterized protein n=1 Tax=Naegleria lovaniensis TaxID=51637 RepID=A0AA88KSG2_NAELO|nr:uncharacterized protein C9374_007185 [Naegleria lovaniensis]KAG2393654.1 hypothetical protein C9374_007185 [Naegleria lovaniensis]
MNLPPSSDNSFLLIKQFKCQYWNNMVAPSAGNLFITPRFILFEYDSSPAQTSTGRNRGNSSSGCGNGSSGSGSVGSTGSSGASSSGLMNTATTMVMNTSTNIFNSVKSSTGSSPGSSNAPMTIFGSTDEDFVDVTYVPEFKNREIKSNTSCILIPLQDIAQCTKSSYLFKSVLWIQTRNNTSYYFVGLKSISNTSTIINHVLDQLKIHEKKSHEISTKRKERPVEIKLDENGFLQAIEYGDVEDEEEQRVIYNAKGKKIDPFAYIKSLTPSSFSFSANSSGRSSSKMENSSSHNSSTDNSVTHSNSDKHKSYTSGFNYYLGASLSGLYSYSVGPVVGLFYGSSSNTSSTTEKKKNISALDHSSLEILIKSDKWHRKYIVLDENGFSIVDPTQQTKTQLFLLYKQITDVTTVNTFTCNISYQESNKHEHKHIKITSIYLPLILNIFLQENQTILFLDEKVSKTIELDSVLSQQLQHFDQNNDQSSITETSNPEHDSSGNEE